MMGLKILNGVKSRSLLLGCFFSLSSSLYASNWSSVSCGDSHTIAIKTNGTLCAWGSNYYDQLGFGDATDRYTPTQVGTDTNWSSVSCGAEYTVAIKTDGTLWAWGRNNYGQLGLGTTTQMNTPTQVGTDTNWSSVSCGYYHTIAVKTDGTLWAWGDNNCGQLGLGDTIDRSIPTQIGTDTNWSFVFCGNWHTIAIKTDGTLWAWGDNYYGQLGLGDTTDRNTPTQVGTDANWSSVSCGNSHSIAIKTDETLWAWGDNGNGQLGLGDTTDRNTPTQVGTDANWSSVSCGDSHTIAVKTDGTLWAWGWNYNGQLGLGDTTDRTVPVLINAAPILSWTTESGYNSDGLNPESGSPSTVFYYRIKYTDADNDAPLSGYPKVHILKGGIELSNSPFSMSYVTGNYGTGAIYTYSTTLSTGTDYTYYFEAYDSNSSMATGTPTSSIDAPDVTNNAPTLSWTGEPSYETDGLDYEIGTDTMVYTFKVKYTDADNDPPQYVRLMLKESYIPLDLALDMSQEDTSDTDYTDGAIFYYSISLSTVSDAYYYYFDAQDYNGAVATGTATSQVNYPDVYREKITISGQITESGSGTEMSGVTVNLKQGANIITAPVTDSGGNYSFVVYFSQTSYRIEPEYSGYYFEPSSYSFGYDAFTGDRTYNFTGTYTGQNYYTVYGYVYDEYRNPIPGTVLTLTGDASGTTTADSSGYYQFSLADGNYTVNVSSTGWSFSPDNISFTVSGSDLYLQDFSGTRTGNYYEITGYCIDNDPSNEISDGSGIQNAYVYLYYNGTTYDSVYTDSGGYFYFNNIPEGYYELYAEYNGTKLHIGDGETDHFAFYPLASNKYNLKFYLGDVIEESRTFDVWGNVFDPDEGGSCEIHFSGVVSNNVEIKIYDTAGRIIRKWTISGNEATSGIEWDGKDDSGEIVANGVYFIQITGSGIDERKPVAVIK